MQTRRNIIIIIVLCISLLSANNVEAASCYGSSCSGQDPQEMGCSAYTVSHIWWSGYSGTLYTELRYSPAGSCYANWTRASNNEGNVRHLRAELTKNDNIFTVIRYEDSSSYSLIWTNMESAAYTWCSIGRMGYPGSGFDTVSDPICG